VQKNSDVPGLNTETGEAFNYLLGRRKKQLSRARECKALSWGGLKKSTTPKISYLWPKKTDSIEGLPGHAVQNAVRTMLKRGKFKEIASPIHIMAVPDIPGPGFLTGDKSAQLFDRFLATTHGQKCSKGAPQNQVVVHNTLSHSIKPKGGYPYNTVGVLQHILI